MDAAGYTDFVRTSMERATKRADALEKCRQDGDCGVTDNRYKLTCHSRHMDGSLFRTDEYTICRLTGTLCPPPAREAHDEDSAG
jgi:hypothetical protein